MAAVSLLVCLAIGFAHAGIPFDIWIDAAATVHEADGSVTVNVHFTGDPTTTATVQYSTVDGTATSPGDYTGQNGTLVFAPGETEKQITIAIVNNNVSGPNKGFTVQLSNATGPALLGLGG